MGCSCSGDRFGEEEKEKADLFAEIIKEHLKEHNLLLYTFSTCENSTIIKQMLKQENIEFEYFDLDKLKDGNKILHALEKMTYYKKPPFVFHNQLYVGGVNESKQLIRNIIKSL